MIVKFLKNSKTFAAVSYNDKRVNNGEAELLVKENFGNSICLFDDSLIHKEYLKLWSEKNKRVKNPQLHVVFSAKHDSLDKNQLKAIAIEWLNEMGYGEVPYLIYFHNNSNHNHVHIVSTRVDKNGFKINDSFEHERGLKVLNKIMCVDELNSLRSKLSGFLRFSFSTRTQFKELLSKSGFTVHDNPGTASLLVGWGSSKLTLGYELIDYCSQRYFHVIDKKRRSQLQALIYKYAQIFNRDEFCYFMKQQFGLDFIFYGKDNNINGYTILDYSNKSIYKGSEVLTSKFLNKLFEGTNGKFIDAVKILESFVDENKYSTQNRAEKYLKRYGIVVEGDKIVDMYGKSYGIPDAVLTHWAFMSRLEYMSKLYKIDSFKDLKFLASYLRVDYDALKHFKFQDNSIYIDFYKSILAGSKKTDGTLDMSVLSQNGLNLYNFDNEAYIVDNIHNSIIPLNTVLPELSEDNSYVLINNDVFIPVNSSNGPVLDMSLINFDTNIGSSSGKGKRRRK